MIKFEDVDKTMLSIHYNVLKNGQGAFDVEFPPWFANWIRSQGKNPDEMTDIFCNAVGVDALFNGILALNDVLGFIPELKRGEQ